jgi:hypothetical protein
MVGPAYVVRTAGSGGSELLIFVQRAAHSIDLWSLLRAMLLTTPGFESGTQFLVKPAAMSCTPYAAKSGLFSAADSALGTPRSVGMA